MELGTLSLPELSPAREAVLDALAGLCSGDEATARQVLGLSQGQRAEVVKNAALRTSPARPAGEVYTGVLYGELGLATLSPAAARRARRSLLVFSGLWGVLRTGDRIPSYRCAAGVRLPGIGPLASFWRGPLAGALPGVAGAGLVLDLRSAPYAAMWQPPGEVARRTVAVRVVTGQGRVVSHANKAVKGRLLRALLESGAAPRTPRALAGTLRELGFAVAADGEGAPPGRIDVIVTPPTAAAGTR